MLRRSVMTCFVSSWVVTTALEGQENGFFADHRLVPNLNTSADDIALRLTEDGLEAVLKSTAGGNHDIWITRRATVEDDFDLPELLPDPVSSSADEADPCISADGLELYFHSRRSGNVDLWMAWREERGEAFANVRALSEINTVFGEGGPSISADGRLLIFQSDRPGPHGSYDLWVASRPGLEDPFGDVQNLGSKVNGSLHEFAACLSFDGSTLLFARSDFANIPADIYMATRVPGTLTFSTPIVLRAPVNSPDWDSGNALSADWPRTGAKIYFGSYRPGGLGEADIYEATWTVVLDDLHCTTSDCGGVQLRWSNPNGLEYTAVSVRRGTRRIADLDPAELEFTDVAAEPGTHVYTVSATYNGAAYFQRCTVEVACARPRFLRGECNADGTVDISDAVCVLEWLFLGGEEPACHAAPNSNGDAAVDISDATYLLSFLFLGGPPPVAPYPECGAGELAADEALGCAESHPTCP